MSIIWYVLLADELIASKFEHSDEISEMMVMTSCCPVRELF